VKGKFDTKTNNDVFSADPGRLVPNVQAVTPAKAGVQSDVLDAGFRRHDGMGSVVQTIGGPKVQLKKYANHHWQLFVDGKPFAIRAITYSVTPVGRSPDRGTWNVSKDWQLLDTNHNGLHDGFFESYVDKNGNGMRDPDEPGGRRRAAPKGSWRQYLRAYHHLYDKELFRRLHASMDCTFFAEICWGLRGRLGSHLDRRHRLSESGSAKTHA